MKWTTSKPDKPGWYWYRPVSDAPMVLYLGLDHGVLYWDMLPLSMLYGEWSTEPIQEPED